MEVSAEFRWLTAIQTLVQAVGLVAIIRIAFWAGGFTKTVEDVSKTVSDGFEKNHEVHAEIIAKIEAHPPAQAERRLTEAEQRIRELEMKR